MNLPRIRLSPIFGLTLFTNPVGPNISMLATPCCRQEERKDLARYMIRASLPQEKTTSLPAESSVIYESKDGKEEKVFNALGWMAAVGPMCRTKGESPMMQMRPYGYLSTLTSIKGFQAIIRDLYYR